MVQKELVSLKSEILLDVDEGVKLRVTPAVVVEVQWPELLSTSNGLLPPSYLGHCCQDFALGGSML